ncbi:MAG: alpha/beta fold hydrolase [Polyangiaceae bacterium]
MLVGAPSAERALLVIHGFAGQPSAWDEVVEGLGVNVVRVRLPGHGPAPEILGETFDDVVDALADELGSNVCDVAAYSMGARVALGLMVRHPSRVRRAVLVGVNPGLKGEALAARRAWDEGWAQQIEAEGVDAFADAWAALPLFASQRRLPPAVSNAQRADRRNHTADGLAWAMRHLGTGHMPSYRDALGDLDPEVTLVVGALDQKYVAIASEMATELPHGRVVQVPEVGHNVVLEAPEACRQAVHAMLQT